MFFLPLRVLVDKYNFLIMSYFVQVYRYFYNKTVLLFTRLQFVQWTGVREADVFRHDGGPIRGPPDTPQNHGSVVQKGLRVPPQLGHHYAERCLPLGQPMQIFPVWSGGCWFLKSGAAEKFLSLCSVAFIAFTPARVGGNAVDVHTEKTSIPVP